MIILLIWMLTNLGLYAQAKFVVITGETINRQSKYAYLKSNSEVYSSKIVGNTFEFKLPKTNSYELGMLFLWSDSLSNEKVNQMFKSRDNEYRTIAIEDLHVVVSEVTKEAIVKGGAYNFQLDEMFQGLKAKTYLDFFDKHPDSPVSLTMLRVLISMARIAPYFRSELTLKVYYDKLSDNLRASEKGKELWAMIEPMYRAKH